MRQIPGSEMIDLVNLFAVLLIFFSIDVRARKPDDDDEWHDKLFEWTSRIGGITAALGLALAGISMFIAEEKHGFHVMWVAVPAGIAMTCAIVLGVEMLFVRDRRD
ncbi:MAG TPA: hypothetical protein VK030_05405 [Actinomycetales bacterium]|nr:hypothetical protein [Actinomycetales bacterium]